MIFVYQTILRYKISFSEHALRKTFRHAVNKQCTTNSALRHSQACRSEYSICLALWLSVYSAHFLECMEEDRVYFKWASLMTMPLCLAPSSGRKESVRLLRCTPWASYSLLSFPHKETGGFLCAATGPALAAGLCQRSSSVLAESLTSKEWYWLKSLPTATTSTPHNPCTGLHENRAICSPT